MKAQVTYPRVQVAVRVNLKLILMMKMKIIEIQMMSQKHSLLMNKVIKYPKEIKLQQEMFMINGKILK
jgi:hypothetical protein